ncbi:MAG: nicotinate-nucleotide diphosphorylase (carboxylating), partial [Pseudomonadales bacterium]|nr:nicotinate-nucleotide diphosphorylase (carboxylating) [Pseudomonadales bacterium]
MLEQYLAHLDKTVSMALEEDRGGGDITAELIPANRAANARVITRENATICGRPWVDEVFRPVDPAIEVTWAGADGDRGNPD